MRLLRYYIRKIYNETKWACQRVFRGWDDRISWSIDYYLAENMPLWLLEIKKYGGYPSSLESKEEWDAILDKIIEGFRTHKRYADADIEIMGEDDSILPFEEIVSRIDAVLKVRDEGLELFIKYFDHLWW